ncbi:MAG: inner membrane protein YiaA [Oceanospirillaceae bacterium]
MNTLQADTNQPTNAYKMASLCVLAIGIAGFLLGLWNAQLLLSEKGFYFSVFLLALFSSVTLQKSIRDREEGIAITKIFMTICWASFSAAIILLVIGLKNADMALSEKGFYAMSFLMSLFAVITVQKNTRDLSAAETEVLVSATKQEEPFTK